MHNYSDFDLTDMDIPIFCVICGERLDTEQTVYFGKKGRDVVNNASAIHGLI